MEDERRLRKNSCDAVICSWGAVEDGRGFMYPQSDHKVHRCMVRESRPLTRALISSSNGGNHGAAAEARAALGSRRGGEGCFTVWNSEGVAKGIHWRIVSLIHGGTVVLCVQQV